MRPSRQSYRELNAAVIPAVTQQANNETVLVKEFNKEDGDNKPSGVLVTALAALVAFLYMISSGLAILVNKHCLVTLRFPYPVTLTWLGLFTTSLGSAIAVHTWLPAEQRRGITLRYYITHVLPCGFAMAVAFYTGNMSFMYLTLSFVQMLKASTPVVTMLMLFIFKLEKPSIRLIVSVCVISFGVLVAGMGEGHASAIGIITMIISITAEALRLVLMQYLMDPKGGELHPLEGLMYISSACMISLLLQAAIWEWSHMFKYAAYRTLLVHPLEFLTAACAGFGVNLLAILVIKLTSSLTLKPAATIKLIIFHKNTRRPHHASLLFACIPYIAFSCQVLGSAKDAALVVVGVLFLHEQVTGLELGGYLVSLLGFVAYNVVKLQQRRESVEDIPSLAATTVKLA